MTIPSAMTMTMADTGPVGCHVSCQLLVQLAQTRPFSRGSLSGMSNVECFRRMLFRLCLILREPMVWRFFVEVQMEVFERSIKAEHPQVQR